METLNILRTLYKEYYSIVEENASLLTEGSRKPEKQLALEKLKQYLLADIGLVEKCLIANEMLTRLQVEGLKSHFYHRDHPQEMLRRHSEIDRVRRAIFSLLYSLE